MEFDKKLKTQKEVFYQAIHNLVNLNLVAGNLK
jgi:hypothetical protein